MHWRLYVLYDSHYEKAYAKLHFGRSVNIRFVKFTGCEVEFMQQEMMNYHHEWRDGDYVGVCKWDCNTRTSMDTRNLENTLLTDADVVQVGATDDQFSGFMTTSCMIELLAYLETRSDVVRFLEAKRMIRI